MSGNSIVSGQIWLKLDLIQAFMNVLASFKNEKIPIKTKDARVVTTFLQL